MKMFRSVEPNRYKCGQDKRMNEHFVNNLEYLGENIYQSLDRINKFNLILNSNYTKC